MVTEAECRALMAALTKAPGLMIAVDLEEQSIVCGEIRYELPSTARRIRLLNGWDIDLTNSFRDQIADFNPLIGGGGLDQSFPAIALIGMRCASSNGGIRSTAPPRLRIEADRRNGAKACNRVVRRSRERTGL